MAFVAWSLSLRRSTTLAIVAHFTVSSTAMPSPLRPPPYAVDERSLEADTRVDIFTAGGPGGQHRNKTQNAVRLHHAPSGLVVSATERRSLEDNRHAAVERL